MRRLILVLTLALLALPTAAQAAFFPPEVIDGPNADLVSVGDIDLGRDGYGGLVYLKNDGGAAHVFLSVFADGAFRTPARIDQGLVAASSQPVIAASDNNRIAVAYVNDGTLFTTVKGKDATGFSAPVPVASGGVSNPSIDMSINGVTYLSFTQNGDVRAARAERDSPQFNVLAAPLDIDPGRDAGTGSLKRSRVAVSADGTALVVWGEDGADGRTHVFARRLFEMRPSQAPQDLTLDQIDGVAAGPAQIPEVDIQYDSSYAQVVFRHQTAGGPRMVMRKLVGSQFEAPVPIDGGGATGGSVDLTGRGEGIFTAWGTGNEVLAGTLFARKPRTFGRVDGGNGIEPRSVPAVGENERGVIAWFQGSSPADATVRGRIFNSVEKWDFESEVQLSSPDFGPVRHEDGLDVSPSRAGDVPVVFMQGGPADKRLVAAIQDRPPTRMDLHTTEKIRRLTRLRWAATLDLLGSPTYTVILNGRPIAQTQQTELIPRPGQIPEGEHRWAVTATDRRGQTVVSRTRRLRVDNTPPTLRVSISRRARVVTVRARGGDPRGRLKSGLGRIVVDWGDKRFRPMKGRASRRYARNGTYTIRVKAIDRALNETVVTRRVRVTGR
jgi:hypothetical protein